MKRVLVIAALLMVGCGNNQNNQSAAQEQEQTPKKVSLTVDKEKIPELKMVKPEGEAIKIEVVTANKDLEYIKKKGIKLKDAQ